MTTVQITLPDSLAQEAERAGLLAPDSMERILREQLRSRAWEQLKDAMDRANGSVDPNSMSPEEVAAFIKRMRAQEGLNPGTR